MSSTPRVILIVEDDEETGLSLSELLQLLGYGSEIAEHGKIALDRLRGDPTSYCLVLLDLMLPIMDGWTFLSEQARDPAIRDIPVAIVSAAPDVQTRAAASAAVAVLPKPIDTARLRATVERYC